MVTGRDGIEVVLHWFEFWFDCSLKQRHLVLLVGVVVLELLSFANHLSFFGANLLNMDIK